ncbi:unnamed protein product [Arctogadus glacialis]
MWQHHRPDGSHPDLLHLPAEGHPDAHQLSRLRESDGTVRAVAAALRLPTDGGPALLLAPLLGQRPAALFPPQPFIIVLLRPQHHLLLLLLLFLVLGHGGSASHLLPLGRPDTAEEQLRLLLMMSSDSPIYLSHARAHTHTHTDNRRTQHMHTHSRASMQGLKNRTTP